ncbi:hypothetical protein HC928_02710 [bacterium]|nr:hypothetical protein [bacterium]
MTLFPQLSDSYYVDNDHNLLKLMDYTYAKNITINQSFWSEADIDSRFEVGDQALWNDIYGNLPAFRRRQFNFNHIRRIKNMISGRQRQNRKSMVASPVEGSDDGTADQFSKLLFYANSHANVLHTLSDAFDGALTTGMNLLSVWMDYRKDPVNGDIAVDNVAYNGYLIDPYFQKMDLSDCNNIWTRKYLTRNQVLALLPGREDEIKDFRGWGNRDGKFQFMPQAYNYGMQDLLLYDEFWYLDTRKQKMLVDTESGETKEWRGTEEDLREFLVQFPQVITIDAQIPTVKLGIVVQGKTMYHGPNPLGIDRYPFVPVWGYYNPQIPYFPYRVQGVVRGLRDAQYLYNRRRIIELDVAESQITSGHYYREDALVNPKDVFLQGQGRGVALKNTGRSIAEDIQKIPCPEVSSSFIQLSELLSQEMPTISGVNEELLGAATDDKAATLSMLRQGAGLTTLQVLFDNLDMSQKLLGTIEVELIQQNWTSGKVRRIINQEPSQEFYNRAFGKYDVVVEEGLNTSTQKQLQSAQLVQYLEMGILQPTPPVLDAILSGIPLQNKKEIMDGIAQQQQQQQQQAQMAQQTQMEVLKAQIQDLQAKAMANEGLGVERASRVQENQALAVERIAEAEKDRDLGVYDRIKAVKELSSMDLEDLARSLEIIEMLKSGERNRGEKGESGANKNPEK